MNSKRFYKVVDGHGITVAAGHAFEGPTRVNSMVINVAAAVAAIYGLDAEKAVTAGKTEAATGLRAARKGKVKEGEPLFKAVAA